MRNAKTLLLDVDAAPVADEIQKRLQRSVRPMGVVNKRPSYLPVLDIVLTAGALRTRNSYHLQLLFVKALRALQAAGVIELVSLCKTRLKRGLIETETGRPFAFELIESVERRCAPLLRPARFIRDGDSTR